MQPSTTISKSQRVFKFRAWDKKRKRMYEVLHLHLDAPNGIWATVKGFDIINDKHIYLRAEPEDVTIMQFTGLLDKNEKEIYEHDIKRETIEYDEWDEVLYFVCVWIKEWAMFAWLSPDEYQGYIDGGGVYGLDMTMFCTYPAGADEPKMDITICGNIYQNPELLTQQ